MSDYKDFVYEVRILHAQPKRTICNGCENKLKEPDGLDTMRHCSTCKTEFDLCEICQTVYPSPPTCPLGYGCRNKK